MAGQADIIRVQAAFNEVKEKLVGNTGLTIMTRIGPKDPALSPESRNAYNYELSMLKQRLGHMPNYGEMVRELCERGAVG